MSIPIRPYTGLIAIKHIPQSGLSVPKSVVVDSTRAEVLAVGPDPEGDKIHVKAGDIVLLAPGPEAMVRVHKKEYILTAHTRIVAVMGADA